MSTNWTYGDGIYGAVLEGNRLVAVTEGNSPAQQQDRARRIVACVNACDGIPVETLEKEASQLTLWCEQVFRDRVDMAERNLDLKDLCVELLSALSSAQATLAHCKADVGYTRRQTETAIKINATVVKAEQILGVKKL